MYIMVSHKLTGALLYLITVVLVVWLTYYLWVSQLFFDEEEIIPLSFQLPYSSICKCSGWHESSKEWLRGPLKGEIGSCFESNREKLSSAARKSFSPITQEQYEHCLDFVPLIGDETDILFAVKSCIVNAHHLDKSLIKITEANSPNSNYLLLLCAVLVGYFYVERKSRNNKCDSERIETIRRVESTPKNHSTKTIKLENNSEIHGLRTIASIKLSNRNAVPKRSTPAFPKPYPMPIRFPSKVHTMMNQPVPVMMFQSNSPAFPYMSNHSSCSNFKNESEVYGKKATIDNGRYRKINSNEYSCSTYQSSDYRSKPRWENHNTKGLKSSDESLNFISDGNSSTPKKQKIATKSSDTRILANPLSTVPSGKHENVDTHNVLDGLDNLDMDFSDNTITVASIAETQDAQKLKEDIKNEFKNSVQLIAKKTQISSSPEVPNEKLTEEKENCRYGKDLVEKVALNVIGNEKDNEAKISSKVSHFPSCPLPTLSGGWPKAPTVDNQYNVPLYDMNENSYPRFMASPLFGNPIWNNPNAFTNSARDN